MKKLYIIILCICLSACVFENAHELNVKIINKSKQKIYVDEANNVCDSCGVMQDVRIYCSHNSYGTLFPKVINIGDSAVMRTQLNNIETIQVINVDSLDDYCNKSLQYNITNRRWVKILTSSVNTKNKTCTFIIR